MKWRECDEGRVWRMIIIKVSKKNEVERERWGEKKKKKKKGGFFFFLF